MSKTAATHAANRETLRHFIGAKEVNTNPFWFTSEVLTQEFLEDEYADLTISLSSRFHLDETIKLELM